MITDPISDLISRINNANERFLEKVDIPASKFKEEIIRTLKEEGYIASYKKIEDCKQGILRVYLKYTPEKERVIKDFMRVSKPGLKLYKKWNKIPVIYRGLGTAIVTTSKGVMTNKEARERHLGGEIICTVW
jgi:small subunit ribosomal protein S8